MVDLVLLQSVSYVAAAIGVLIAAIYYMLTLRTNQRNMRINITNNLMQTIFSPEACRNILDLMHMEWTDYGDFENRYGTENNPDSASIRISYWATFNVLGELLRKGVVDADTLYTTIGWFVVMLWQKFELVVKEHRRRYMSRDQWTGFEYLAGRMLAVMKEKDPEYRVPATYDKYIPDK